MTVHPPLGSFLTPDAFLHRVLASQAVDTSLSSPARRVQIELDPVLRGWGNGNIRAVHPSGSFAKGTANRSSTDIDLFVSLDHDTPNTLAEIHETLFKALTAAGYSPRRQNVSIGVRVDSYDVDLVPGRLQPAGDEDHSLWRRKQATWIKTNVWRHINAIASSGCTDEIRIIKLWRDRRQLDFPSFYLELAVWNSLQGCRRGDTAANVATALRFLAALFPTLNLIDPSNTNNVVSDDLTAAEKFKIAAAARVSLNGRWCDLL